MSCQMNVMYIPSIQSAPWIQIAEILKSGYYRRKPRAVGSSKAGKMSNHLERQIMQYNVSFGKQSFNNNLTQLGVMASQSWQYDLYYEVTFICLCVHWPCFVLKVMSLVIIQYWDDTGDIHGNHWLPGGLYRLQWVMLDWGRYCVYFSFDPMCIGADWLLHDGLDSSPL